MKKLDLEQERHFRPQSTLTPFSIHVLLNEGQVNFIKTISGHISCNFWVSCQYP